MNNWKDIWDNRSYDKNLSTLQALIVADGFDSDFGSFTQDDWLNYINDVSTILNIVGKKTSIYDVGCGSGAFLYPFYQTGHRVGGLDYSDKLLNIAMMHMLNSNFDLGEAIAMDTNSKYDIVVSNSVFHYFPTKDYAKIVVEKMLKKAKQKVAILDLNDNTKKGIAESLRQGIMGEEEYLKKYGDLNQLYYDKKWFKAIAVQNGYKIKIWDQKIDNYLNSSYRFNIVIEK
jgi:2-polyprenyl-3-methyl-5-hydroxy-6-metoxy-1,4-benzoquinol methylase